MNVTNLAPESRQFNEIEHTCSISHFIMRNVQALGASGDVIRIYSLGLLHPIYGIQEHCSIALEVSL